MMNDDIKESLKVLGLIVFALVIVIVAAGCSSDEKPRPIKSSAPTCCQPRHDNPRDEIQIQCGPEK